MEGGRERREEERKKGKREGRRLPSYWKDFCLFTNLSSILKCLTSRRYSVLDEQMKGIGC